MNAPIQAGITDDTYMEMLFQPIMDQIMQVFRPGAIVLQCGADSLTGDRLGCFNLTTKGHAACVKLVQNYGVPTLVLGGGGYTIRNVARCWAYETATLLGKEDIPNDIPFNDYYEYYAPDFELHLQEDTSMDNANSIPQLETIRNELLQQLADLKGAPSVQMQTVPPPFRTVDAKDAERDADEDVRMDESGSGGEKKQHSSELYDNVD